MLINPYQEVNEKSPVVRSNFHTHAGTGPKTCGHHGCHIVLSQYKKMNYDAICLSNHNMFISRLHRSFGMLEVPGYEYTAQDVHIVCLGTRKVVRDRTQHQRAIDEANAAGGIAIVAHPNWPFDYFFTKEQIDTFKNYAGIELVNGSVETGKVQSENRDNLADSANVFDYILSKGTLIWGFGADDFHDWWHIARAWNMIYCKKEQADMFAAIRRGAFYCSTGVVLDELKLNDGVITVRTRSMTYAQPPMLYRFIGKDGVILKEERGVEASYTTTGDEAYVRIEASAPCGNKLYTQPLYNPSFFGVSQN